MILLNDILRLSDPKNVKVRFNLSFGTKRPAIDYFTDQTEESKQHMLVMLHTELIMNLDSIT